MAKRRGNSANMDMKGKCGCWHGGAKLASMTFILFLVTVWPTVGNALLSVHWGWYLGATILFSLWHWKMHWMMHMRK